MMMYPGNIYPALPSENVALRELWASYPKAAKAGWTFVGSPAISDGLYLGGTPQYATKNLVNEIDTPYITFVIEFTPNFAVDADEIDVFWDATGGICTLLKHNNANSNILRLVLGGTTIFELVGTGYQSHWRVGERNVLIVSSVTGDTNVWLNGTKIVDGDATAWTPQHALAFFVGADNGGAEKFDGVIHELHIFHDVWEGLQEENWRQTRTFNFTSRAGVWLDMKSKLGLGVTGSEFSTRDKSGSGRQTLLGNGTAAASFPTFHNPGFETDGATDEYLEITQASGLLSGAQHTTVICFEPYFGADATWRTLYDSTSGLYSVAKSVLDTIWITVGGTNVAVIPAIDWLSSWHQYEKNIFVVSAENGDTNAWLNSVKLVDHDNTAWTPADPTAIQIGINAAKDDRRFHGVHHHFSVYPFMLSDSQVRFISHGLKTGAL
jgi:hypothetical protein